MDNTMDEKETEFIIEADVTDDPERVDTIRKQINTWAAGIPHHPFIYLGDDITIQSIWFRPGHVIGLRSQYEHREKKAHEEPYRGQSVPPRTYTSLSQVKEWEFEFNTPYDFTETDDWYYANGSQYVTTCGRCSGSGRLRCDDCGGSGSVVCPDCRGAGTVSCYSCNGSGQKQKKCWSCSGKGTKWNSTDNRNEQCSSCGGRGTWFEKCTSCWGSGRKDCTKCNTTGRVTCSDCGGDGFNTCWNCSGQGRLLHSFQVRHHLYFKDQDDLVIHETVAEEFPGYKTDKEIQNRPMIFEKDEKSLGADELEQAPPLSERFQPMQHKAKGESTPSHTRVLRQRLRVYRVDTYQVNYIMDGREYKLLVLEDGDIYAPVSPISELRKEYVSSAEQCYEEKNYHDAWHKISTALEMGEDEPWSKRTSAELLSQKIDEKINNHYRSGNALGLLLSVAAFLPLIMWLADKTFFLLPSIRSVHDHWWFMEVVHPYVVYGFFGLLMIRVIFLNWRYMKKKLRYRVKKNPARVLLPALFFFRFAAGYTLLLIIAIATGLTMLPVVLVMMAAELFGIVIKKPSGL